MTRGWKFFKGISLGMVTLIGLFLLTVGILWVSFPEKWAAEKAAEIAKIELPGWKISLGRLAPFPLGNFFVGPIHVESPNKEVIFDLERLEFNYSVGHLMIGKISIKKMVAQHPKIYLRPGYDKLFPPAKNPPPSHFANINFQRTPVRKIWEEIEKILKGQLKGLPPCSIESVAINQFQMSSEDENIKVDAPLLDITASLFLNSEKQEAKFQINQTKSQAPLFIQTQKGQPIQLRGNLSLKLDAQWKENHQFSGSLQASLSQLKIQMENKIGTYETLEVYGKGEIDVEKGDVALQGLNIKLPGWVHIENELSISDFGLTQFSGGSTILLTKRKNLDPLVQFILAAAPQVKVFPEADFQAQLFGKLAGETVQNLNIHELDIRTKANIQNLPILEGASAINHEAEIHVRNMKEVTVQTFHLDIPGLGFKCQASGNVLSNLPFPDLAQQQKNSKELFKTLRENLSANVTGSLEIKSPKKTFSKNMKLSGNLFSKFSLQKENTKEAHVLAFLELDHFSADIQGGLKFKNLNFHLPVKKNLTLGDFKRKKLQGAQVLRKSFMEQLGSISSTHNNFTADLIQKDELRLEQVKGDFWFDGNNLALNQMTANLLGGNLWLKSTLLPDQKNLNLTVQTEWANVDVSKLSKEKIVGDSTISFDAQMNVSVNPNSTLTRDQLISDMDAQFHLTHIGDQTLDRGIAFLDPKGENPSLVQARGLLKQSMIKSALKNPEVSMKIAHGILDADLRFPGVQFANVSIPIRGVSVKDMLRLASFQKTVDSFIPLIQMLKYLQITGIDDPGNLVFSMESK